MNLHGIVRSVINVVNVDILALVQKSAGYTTDAAGKQTPQYTDVPDVRIQVQAQTGKDLKHIERLNIQGVLRSVYMYGNTQGVVRVDEKGGDLLHFPQVPGDAVQKWKVVAVVETWPDWSKVIVCLQTN